jgi:hypothetical protein
VWLERAHSQDFVKVFHIPKQRTIKTDGA